ncbi:MAG: ZIP family metal transporter [Planctomycetota bacterium]|nr:ZIP family metal transporter [Planctomycetota bacterium]MDA1213436.1 ZIP family metal transporter [Planctomycetota bacterium]
MYALLAVYCLLIVGASLAGGWLPSLIKLTHTRMQILMSLVGGLMLGIGIFHMFPHAVVELGPSQIDRAAWWMMCGLVTMFFLLRTFHFHQHDHDLDPQFTVELHPGHDHDHDHDHHRGVADVHHLSWIGVFTGLAIHTLIDGMALGASMQSEARHAGAGWLIGLGTFLAIVLHKPLDAVSITSLMAAGGWTKSARMSVNLTFALMCPLGAGMFVLGVDQLSTAESVVIGCALAFSAGVFLCIALSDLLPEMEFHSHNRLQLSSALLFGLALAYGIHCLEPDHSHQHERGESTSLRL